MTQENIRRKPWIIPVAVLALGAVAGFFVLMNRASETPTMEMAQVERDLGPRPQWTASAQAPKIYVHRQQGGLEFALDGDSGPLVTFALPDGLEDSQWLLREGERFFALDFSGRLDGGRFTASWTFVDGDPQVEIFVAWLGVPASALGREVSLTMATPGSRLRTMAEGLGLRELAPRDVADRASWVGLDLDAAHLTFSSVGGAALRASREETSSTAELVLWAGVDWAEDCPADVAPIDLHARMVLTIGAPAPTALSLLPGGLEAAMVPVFTEPLTPILAPGAAQDPEDWLRRARTLLYGHSSPEDPRYGNGGLLGSNFGGVIAMPEAIWNDPLVQDWIGLFGDGSVDLVPEQGALGTPRPRPVVVTSSAPCETILTGLDDGRPVLHVRAASPGVDDKSVESLGTALPLLVDVPSLDGRRVTLVDGVFSRQELESRAQRGGIFYFSTPFVATRNPLVGVSTQSLLEPEPRGAWTLHPELARALGRIELMQESGELKLMSASELHRRSRAIEDVSAWWSPTGSLMLRNGSETVLEKLTLVLHTHAEIDVRATAEMQPSIEERQQDGQRWIWWDLEPHTTYEVRIDALGLSPVVWKRGS